MPIQYALRGTEMKEQPLSMEDPTDATVVQVVTHEEFDRICAPALDHPIALQTLTRTLSCHADLLDTCTVGVIAVPHKDHLLKSPRPIAFYLDGHRLILAEDTPECADVVRELAHTHRVSSITPARTLFYVCESLIIDDPSFLERFEERLEKTEESIIEMDRAEANRAIAQIRRELLRLDYYYEQLEDIGILLEENANELVEESDAHLFGVFSRHANRLFDRTRTLKEYSLQLYELQQTQLDVKQNEVMRWLTVVTSIFVPLTLVTSWYGMNFQDMPELSWYLGYPVVIVICLTIVVAELVYFKRRKWL